LRTGVPAKGIVDAIRVLTDEPPSDAILLIEAGDLKKGAPLRSLVESAPSAMALPCYADESRSLDAIIDATVSAAGMTIALDARQALKRNLGGDRLASRSEIEKLVLYAQGAPQITVDHVEALAGDASGPSVDAVIDAILLGRIEEFDAAFLKITAANQLVPLLTSTLRQFQSLDLLRDQVENGGKTAAAAVASARPPVFFGRRDTMEKAVSRWSSQLIRRVLDRLQTVVLQSRERAGLSIPMVRQALLGLAVEGSRRG
jgi:DNA polymerase-3 subunit delta